MGWVSLWEGSELSAPGAATTAVQLSDVGQAGERGENAGRRGACVPSFLTLGTREPLPLGLRLDTRGGSVLQLPSSLLGSGPVSLLV